MTLQDWLENKWLKSHATSASEVDALLGKVARDIGEASNEAISLDWRFAIAYNAILGCATVALRVSGYRAPEGEGHHFRTIESLKYTLAPESDMITVLHVIRKKRSIVSYDAAGTVSETVVSEAVALAEELGVKLRKWLQQNFSNLL